MSKEPQADEVASVSTGETPMTPAGFLQSLESVLQSRRVALTRAAAIAFVESCWELIADDPDVWYRAERFVEAGGVEEMQRQYYPSLYNDHRAGPAR
jgi:hypothetical protein